MLNLISKLKNKFSFPLLHSSRSKGQGLVEYALILSLVSVVGIVIVRTLGQEISSKYETTVCSLEGGEDCDCRVLEDIIVSEYICTGSLFAYQALTSCRQETELSLLVESKPPVEYAMSFNPASNVFEMTNSGAICADLNGSSPSNVKLVSRHTEESVVHVFELGANGEPIYDPWGNGKDKPSGGSSGGSTSGGSTSGGSTSGGSTSGGSTSGGSTSGGSTSGGSTSGGSTSGGSTSGGSTSGGSTSGGTGGAPANSAPVITQINEQILDEGVTKNITLSATDANSDPLTFSAVGTLPAFVTLNASAIPPTLTIAPGFSDANTYSITIQVSDGKGGTDTATFSLKVNDLNRNPVLNPIGSHTVTENTSKSITFTATDPDGDALTYGTTGTLPAFMSFTSPTLTITPGYTHSGSYTITAYATDSAGNVATEAFVVTVEDVNLAPVLASIGTQTVAENATKSVTLSATDPDGDTISYSITSTLPAFMTFTAPNLSIAPDYTHSGSYSVTAKATDSAGNSVSQTFTVNVTDTNRNPVLASISTQTVAENATKSVTLSATDPDGDAITYSITSTLPAFMTFTSPTLSITPGYTHSGTYSVTAKATDSAGNSNSKTFTVNVTEVNRNPVITAVAAQSVNEGASKTVTITATDPDGDTVTLTASGTSGWMSFSSTAGNGTLTLTPGSSDSGTYSVTILANDGKSGTHNISISITVNDVVVTKKVALIVANKTSIGLHASDSAIKSNLEAQSYVVTVFSDEDSSSTVLASNPTVIVISASIDSGTSGTKFTNTSVGVVVLEGALFDEIKLANSSSTDSNETQIKIVTAGHAMAAGLSSGNKTVLNSGQAITYATIRNDGIIIASIDDDTTRATIFAYEKNTEMYENNFNAPGRRVGYFANENIPVTFNTNGWNLFYAAVAWAAG